MNLTEHFTLEEFCASETAARKGIDNTVPIALLPNLRFLARQLEGIRLTIKTPIHVNSGYRCEALNVAVGGTINSAHQLGLAADIIAPGFGDPLRLCKAIAVLDDIPFDQCIYEMRSWCHIGFAESGREPRRELLTIISGSMRKGLIDL